MTIKLFRLPLFLATILFSFQISTAHAGCSGALGNTYNQGIDARPFDQNMFNTAVLFYTNKIRCREGLQQFESENAIFQAAITSADGMATSRTFSHVLPQRGIQTLLDRLTHHNAQYRTAGENIAQNSFYALSGRRFIPSSGCNFRYQDNGQQIPVHSYNSLAREVVDQWENSPGHYANIINRDFTRMGAGLGVDSQGQYCGTVYATQVFSG